MRVVFRRLSQIVLCARSTSGDRRDSAVEVKCVIDVRETHNYILNCVMSFFGDSLRGVLYSIVT